MYKIFTLRHFFTVTPTCFGPCRPSLESLYWVWSKLLYCRYNRKSTSL